MTEGKEAEPVGRLVVAEKAYRRAVELYDVTAGSDPEEHLAAISSLARTLNHLCRNDEAREILDRGERVIARSGREAPVWAGVFAVGRGWIEELIALEEI